MNLQEDDLHEPDEEYLKEQLRKEIEQLKQQLERMQNRSPEMRGITLAMNGDVS